VVWVEFWSLPEKRPFDYVFTCDPSTAKAAAFAAWWQREERLGSTESHLELGVSRDRWARALDYTTTSGLLVEGLACYLPVEVERQARRSSLYQRPAASEFAQ